MAGLTRRTLLAGAGAAAARFAARPWEMLVPAAVKPAFETRGIVLTPADLSWPGWPAAAAEAGLSTIALHPTPSVAIDYVRSEAGQAFVDRCRAHGLQIEYELHAMADLLPRDQFAAAPGMFRAGDDGVRTPDANLCVSSKEALDTVARRAVEIGEVVRPTTGRYFYWGDDGQPWCRCSRCRDLSDSDQSLVLTNALATALRKVDPKAQVAYLAYANTLAPPRSMKPGPGVFLEFAPIHRRYDLPYAHQTAVGLRDRLEVLDANLAVFGAGHAQVLEYWLDLSRFSGWKRPAPRLPWRPDVMAADLDAYGSRGIRHATCFGVFLDGEYVRNWGVPPLAEYGKLLSGWRPLPKAASYRLAPASAESPDDPAQAPLIAAGRDLPRAMQAAAPPLHGDPAFDPAEADRIATSLTLPEGVRFEHPLLERAVRIGLAHIDLTFRGDHPKYGVGAYAGEEHDGFPPTIIAAVDALTLWGMTAQAEKKLLYWLRTFVAPDGAFRYYGPSVSEYGQILTSAHRVMSRGGSVEWLSKSLVPLMAIANRLVELSGHRGMPALAGGVPEADERERSGVYFHNNAWIVRGLTDWAGVARRWLKSATEEQRFRTRATRLRIALLETIRATWPKDKTDWWLAPGPDMDADRPAGRVTATRLGSYTNYRYWPELLGSGVLPDDLAARVVGARASSGGQMLGLTRFEAHADNWPLADYLEGLRALRRTAEYRYVLWGHVLYHQATGHLTAYEQVALPPGRKVADYCLPCQLVAVRAARRLA